jgi:hypothetical protein
MLFNNVLTCRGAKKSASRTAHTRQPRMQAWGVAACLLCMLGAVNVHITGLLLLTSVTCTTPRQKCGAALPADSGAGCRNNDSSAGMRGCPGCGHTNCERPAAHQQAAALLRGSILS